MRKNILEQSKRIHTLHEFFLDVKACYQFLVHFIQPTVILKCWNC